MSLLLLTLLASAPALPGVNDAAPAFQLRKLDDTKVRLIDFAYPGTEQKFRPKKAVLIDFFRTDCGPCRANVPRLSDIAETYGPKGLEVVMVALLEQESGREKLTKYLSEAKVEFTVLVDDSEYWTKKYLGDRVELPSVFLVRPDGTIAWTAKGLAKEGELEGALGMMFEDPKKVATRAGRGRESR